MPKKPIDYSKSFIYKICCRDPVITDIYIGSTTDLVKRRCQHKSTCNNPKATGHNSPVYNFIRENGGFDNWEVVKIENYECDCGEDLRKREREIFDELKPTLNNYRPSVSVEETKISLYERNKAWREKNKEYHKEYQKERYENDKDYKEYHKQYVKERYKKNKDKLTQGHQCPCGGRYTNNNKSTHFKTNKHLAWQAKQ
jgi:hypothetical protein